MSPETSVGGRGMQTENTDTFLHVCVRPLRVIMPIYTTVGVHTRTCV